MVSIRPATIDDLPGMQACANLRFLTNARRDIKSTMEAIIPKPGRHGPHTARSEE